MFELIKGFKGYVFLWNFLVFLFLRRKMIILKIYYKIVNCDCYGEDVSECLMVGIWRGKGFVFLIYCLFI